MMWLQKHRVLLCGTILVLIFVLDRWTKAWALNTLSEKRVLIPGVLELSLVHNSRVLFVVDWPVWFIIVLIVVIMMAVVAVVLNALKRKANVTVVGWGLVLIGAYSNVLDRVQLSAVTDFIAVPFWSVFNIADISIVFGVCIVAWQVGVVDKKQQNDTL